jgi:hypothetical protein
MKKLLFVIATLLSLAAKSQTTLYYPFPDTSAFWTVQDWACCWTDCPSPPLGNPVIDDYNFSYFLQGDTVIATNTYHKVYKSPGTAHEHCAIAGTLNNWWILTAEYAGAYRQDTTLKQIYFIYPSFSQEQLLYDFSLNVGDTLSNCVVSTIDSILIGTNYRKQFHFMGSQYSMIEGIGSTAGLLEPFIPFESGGTLTCFSQNGATLYPDTITACYIVTRVNEIKNLRSFSISPNPFHTFAILQVTSEFLNSELVIYNTLGNIVRQQIINEGSIQICRNELCSGFYFFKIISDKGYTASGKVIID